MKYLNYGKKSSQKGLTITSLIVTLVLVGIGGIYGFQIALGFLDQQSLRTAARTALSEVKQNDNSSANSVKISVLRKISVSGIDVNDDDVTVSKSGNDYEVDIDHTKKIKLTQKMNIVMDLNVVETTSK